MPDIGARYEADNLTNSPMRSYRIQTSTPATYTVWVRGMATDAAGDSLHVGVNGTPAATADKLTGFQPNEWGWSRLTMDNLDANLDLSVTGTYTLNVWMREDGLRIDRLLLVTDTTYIPTGAGPAASPIQVISDTVAPGITSHVIAYEYDPLYRLTDAAYTGDINATYRYAYDPVGNMNAYTETVGTETTRVTRYFDDANRLQNAFDFDTGTTSYLYDNNGNLTLIIPPGGAQWLHYGFDQRNLMISHTVSISGTNPQLMATFAYDGNGDRVQQTDSSGSQPVTTTYTNDVVGLTQVLVADDGTEQVYNLFGLDLIGQDEGASTRYLLADGLGSVRTEMVDGTVESMTTYDPYGNLLQQTGDIGTTYGYTGEQQDSSTGLLYLRARYYNPALRSFMGRDPWRGDGKRPQSMNGWSYVNSNPVNLVDPTGNRPWAFPERCHKASSARQYEDCIREELELEGPSVSYDYPIPPKFNPQMTPLAIGTSGCFYGPIPYKGPGYIEGMSGQGGPLGGGLEIVYDFATMEKQNFAFYYGAISVPSVVKGIAGVNNWYSNYLSISISASVGYLKGFRNWGNITDEYKGPFVVYYGQLGSSRISPLSIGATYFHSVPDTSINGYGASMSLSWSFPSNPFDNPLLDFDAGVQYANYIPLGKPVPYHRPWGNTGGVIPALVAADVLIGIRSPLTVAMGVAGGLVYTGAFTPHAVGFLTASLAARGVGVYQAYKWSHIYNSIHTDSWKPFYNPYYK